MKIVLNVIGVLLILPGIVWFLQGVNVLPGSFMTGQTQWAIYGGILDYHRRGLALVCKSSALIGLCLPDNARRS